jgi:RHS repeat-associated protein
VSDAAYDYAYDAEGNLTQRVRRIDGRKWDYTWDHRNRLTAVDERLSSGTLVKRVEYAYDALDRRVFKQVDDNGNGMFDRSEQFVYDGEHIVLRYQNGQLANRYVHNPDVVDQVFADEAVSSLLTPGETHWQLTDNQNSVRQIYDYDEATGTTVVVDRILYESFGKFWSPTNLASAPLFQYTGREYDRDVDLYYYNARWYDANTGVFTSEDPIYNDYRNPYRYVSNSPTNATDPSGLKNKYVAAAQAFYEQVSFWGPLNIAIGAFNWGREGYRYQNDINMMMLDTAGTLVGHPLGYEPQSQAAIHNPIDGTWGKYWDRACGNAARAGEAGLTLGLSEIGRGVYDFSKTGDGTALQQHMGGVAAANLTAAAAIKGGSAQSARSAPAAVVEAEVVAPNGGRQIVPGTGSQPVIRPRPQSPVAGPPGARPALASPRGPRPGSISGNPANRLIETGIPTRNGGWAQRWVRITEADKARWLSERHQYYDHVSDLARKMRLCPEEAHRFRFEQMRQWRTNWLRDFLDNRPY